MFFKRHRTSSHYDSRKDYKFDTPKVTLLVDIEAHAAIEIYCTTRKTRNTQIGMQVARWNAGDLQVLLGNEGL